MTTSSNSSGLPRGMGALHYRGAKFWAVYTDENGHKVQVNTGTNSRIVARNFLYKRIVEVLQAKLALVRAAQREDYDQSRATAGDAGKQGTDRTAVKAHARGRKKNSQGGSR